MCVQKIGAAYTQNVKYNCNSVQVTIQGITHTLDKLLNYTNQSCVLSNDLNTFELYIPAIDLKKWKLSATEFHDKDEKHQHSFSFETYTKA